MPIKLNCVVCGKEFTVIPSRAKTAKYHNYKCHQIGEGRKGGLIRGLQLREQSQKKSYLKVNGFHLHRAVAEKKIGRKLKPREVVHHIDGDIFNNNIQNIEIMTQSEHIKKHLPNMLKLRRVKHGY